MLAGLCPERKEAFGDMSLDESCDVHDTPQLLISLSEIAKEFEIMEELAAMR